jgi:hypothetical protein
MLCFGIGIFVYQLKIMSNVNTEILVNIQTKLDQKSQFEIIVQSLEESLVIFSENKIELVNE